MYKFPNPRFCPHWLVVAKVTSVFSSTAIRFFLVYQCGYYYSAECRMEQNVLRHYFLEQHDFSMAITHDNVF